MIYEKPPFSSLNILYVSEYRLPHVYNIVVVVAAFFLRALTKRKFTLKYKQYKLCSLQIDQSS